MDFDRFRETFQQAGNTIILAIEDADVFEPKTYRQWRELEKSLDTIDGLQNVLSPTTAYYLQRNDSLKRLELQSLARNFNAQTADSAGKLYASLPFYRDLLISKDGTTPLIFAQLQFDQLYNKNIVRIVESVKKVVTDFEQHTDLAVRTSGLPFIRMANVKKVSREIFLMVGLALLVTTAIMFLFLRSVKATLISMLVVIIGSGVVLWTHR
ncbi:MAG: MMPL family transporter [Owenweeksia sp.]|nr:MMPL family transporter [Owenweeksia sp.]